MKKQVQRLSDEERLRLMQTAYTLEHSKSECVLAGITRKTDIIEWLDKQQEKRANEESTATT